MKKLIKTLGGAVIFSLALSLIGLNVASAATTPSLGTTSTYGIVSSIYTNSLNAGLETAITGDVCYTTAPATAPISISGATVTPCPAGTGTDQNSALANLNAQATAVSCMNIGPTPALNAVDIDGAGPLAPGTFTPGCYKSDTSMSITLNTTVTLDGAGTYIFKSGGPLTTGANSKVVAINGASACDVFWIPTEATTLGANSSTSATPTFLGNIFRGDAAGLSITLGHFVNLEGTLLAYGSTVTTDSNTITVPVCAAAPATLNVIKQVVNDNGGVATAGSFNLHVKLGIVDVSGSPAVGTTTPGTAYSLAPGTYIVSEDANASYTRTFSGDCDASGNVTLASGETKTCTITNNDIAVVLPATLTVVKTVVNDNGRTNVIADFPLFVNAVSVVSGVTNTFAPATYTVTETANSNYTQAFSGDCNVSGNVSLVPGDAKVCVITNDDIRRSSGGGGSPAPVPPLIDVVKVPNPLALPDGSGPVTYTYTLRNIGTVPVTDVTMVGDTCSPIVLASGDSNSDAKLDMTETWVYRCTKTLTETHTNTVVATGWANGLTATDIASARVIVGIPAVVPPLIHVTKVPSPLTLPAEGGRVTYTEKITNPGTVALNNVRLTDDKCSPMSYISGDTNGDSKLDVTETWTYTCRTNLTKTTTNTAVASGEANGFEVRDFAIATVVVPATVAPIVVAPTVVAPTPTLPNTGFVNSDRMLVSGIGLVGIFTAFFLLYAIRRKQTK